ncbi:hypothetical protein Tco_0259312, partial [Tanacetum coccineum]
MILTLEFLSFIFDEWGCVGLPRWIGVLWCGVVMWGSFGVLGKEGKGRERLGEMNSNSGGKWVYWLSNLVTELGVKDSGCKGLK